MNFVSFPSWQSVVNSCRVTVNNAIPMLMLGSCVRTEPHVRINPLNIIVSNFRNSGIVTIFGYENKGILGKKNKTP